MIRPEPSVARPARTERLSKVMFAFSALLALACLGIASPAMADTLSLEGVEVGAPGEANSVSVNYFSVSETDDVSIVVAAPAFWDEDHISTQVYLFNQDGDVIATGLDIIGGVVELDVSELEQGSYVLAVGDFPLSKEEAWTGVNDPDYWELVGLFAFDGTYDLTINAENAELAWIDEGTFHAVPELSADGGGAAIILMLGGVALLSERRRRSRRLIGG